MSKTREINDARRVFAEAKEKAKMKPKALVTDGLRAYEEAFKKEFFTLKNPRTQHIRLTSIREHPNNNRIERFHGTVRERDKVMRGLDSDESAKSIQDGFSVYHNFLRLHMSLNDKTPAELVGIDLGLEANKWLGLTR